jgi:hypothetical protein
MVLFLYRTTQICPSNKLAMFLITKALAMSVSTDRTCTLTALPAVPSTVFVSTDPAVVLTLRLPSHVTRCSAIATKGL